MSKDLWCDSFDEKYDECIESGMTVLDAEKEAVKYADGYIERLMDQADMQRKAMKENGM